MLGHTVKWKFRIHNCIFIFIMTPHVRYIKKSLGKKWLERNASGF